MTTTVPKLLKEAHRLRKHLRELLSEIELGPRVMKAQQQTLESEIAIHKEAHDIIGRLKLKIREEELSLKTVNAQVAKYEKQLNDAGSPKEYDGKQSEIRQAKEKVTVIEEVLLQAMEDLERSTAALPGADKQLQDAHKVFEEYKAEAKERLDRMQEDQALSQTELGGIDAQLPPDVKQIYDRLITRHGPDGLAGIANRTCKQCRTSITEQQKITIVGGKFVCCPNCGRGLYVAD